MTDLERAAVTALRQMQAITKVLGAGIGDLAVPDGFFALWGEAETAAARAIAAARTGRHAPRGKVTDDPADRLSVEHLAQLADAYCATHACPASCAEAPEDERWCHLQALHSVCRDFAPTSDRPTVEPPEVERPSVERIAMAICVSRAGNPRHRPCVCARDGRTPSAAVPRCRDCLSAAAAAMEVFNGQ